MMPELKSFTANATPEIHKEIQNYQTYIYEYKYAIMVRLS